MLILICTILLVIFLISRYSIVGTFVKSLDFFFVLSDDFRFGVLFIGV